MFFVTIFFFFFFVKSLPTKKRSVVLCYKSFFFPLFSVSSKTKRRENCSPFARLFDCNNGNSLFSLERFAILICSAVANFLPRGRLSFIPASHKERYHNHAGTIGNYSPWGCSILSASISVRDREQRTEGNDRKRCRRVAENVCCVNDAETLWRNLGQHHETKTIVNFFSFLCIVARISSLIYGTLFSPTRHCLPYRTLSLSLSVSNWASSLTEKNHSLESEWFDSSERILDRSSKTLRFRRIFFFFHPQYSERVQNIRIEYKIIFFEDNWIILSRLNWMLCICWIVQC